MVAPSARSSPRLGLDFTAAARADAFPADPDDRRPDDREVSLPPAPLPSSASESDRITSLDSTADAQLRTSATSAMACSTPVTSNRSTSRAANAAAATAPERRDEPADRAVAAPRCTSVDVDTGTSLRADGRTRPARSGCPTRHHGGVHHGTSSADSPTPSLTSALSRNPVSLSTGPGCQRERSVLYRTCVRYASLPGRFFSGASPGMSPTAVWQSGRRRLA